MIATNNWFGAYGTPGSALDLTGYSGLTVPLAFAPFYAKYSAMITAELAHPSSVGTIPWKLYSCATPVATTFPYSAVRITNPAAAALWPAYAEQP